MPSDDSTVATQADFVPMAVGNTDRVRSVVSVSAHDGVSQQPRPEVHETQLNVLSLLCYGSYRLLSLVCLTICIGEPLCLETHHASVRVVSKHTPDPLLKLYLLYVPLATADIGLSGLSLSLL